MPYKPGDPWPGTTPGGAAHPSWGGYIRFWLLVEIAAGFPFTLGQSSNDRLNAGNVLADASSSTLFGAAGVDPATLPTTSGLWVDVSCDLIDVEITIGASTSAGILSKTEAGTLTAVIYDPTGKYDPANPDSIYALSGRSRLVPGARVLAFCEVVTTPFSGTPGVQQRILFAGTVDEWGEEWTVHPADRRAKVTATDFTKNLVKMDRDEQPPVGQSDTVQARLNRIADYFGFNRPVWLVTVNPVYRTLQSTTLAQSAWELLCRAVQDEIGFIWDRPSTRTGGNLSWYGRETWTRPAGASTLKLGCDPNDPDRYDIVTQAVPNSFDANQINTVSAARTGGTAQHASNTSSVKRWGEKSTSRTDLGLETDQLAAQWATDLVAVEAFPRAELASMTLEPAVLTLGNPTTQQIISAVTAWWRTLSNSDGLVSAVTNVLFAPPEFDYTVQVDIRTIGTINKISADGWTIDWRTTAANILTGAYTFTMGPDAADRLDAGFVLT